MELIDTHCHLTFEHSEKILQLLTDFGIIYNRID